MDPLNELGPLLRFLGVYRSCGSHRGILHVLDVFITFLLSVVLLVMVIWFFNDEPIRLSSPTIPTCIIGIQTLTTCISLVSKTREIAAAVEHLRLSIAQSKFHLSKAYFLANSPLQLSQILQMTAIRRCRSQIINRSRNGIHLSLAYFSRY